MTKLWPKKERGFWKNVDSISSKTLTFSLYKHSSIEDHNQLKQPHNKAETNNHHYYAKFGFSPNPNIFKKGFRFSFHTLIFLFYLLSSSFFFLITKILDHMEQNHKLFSSSLNRNPKLSNPQKKCFFTIPNLVFSLIIS